MIPLVFKLKNNINSVIWVAIIFCFLICGCKRKAIIIGTVENDSMLSIACVPIEANSKLYWFNNKYQFCEYNLVTSKSSILFNIKVAPNSIMPPKDFIIKDSIVFFYNDKY
jgi:hypothetical protein